MKPDHGGSRNRIARGNNKSSRSKSRRKGKEKRRGGEGKKQKCGAVVTDTGGIVPGGTHLDSILDTQP